MPKKVVEKDFDFYIDEYMYNCRSRRLRPKTMQSYEQTLRLFERWCADVVNISEPAAVTDSVLRRYICDLQERGKYTFYASEKTKNINCPERRRDYRNEITVTTINNYIRNLRAFFTWYSETEQQHNPMEKIKTFKNGRKVKDYLEDEEVERLLKCFDKERPSFTETMRFYNRVTNFEEIHPAPDFSFSQIPSFSTMSNCHK